VESQERDKRLATIRSSVRQYLAGIEATAIVFPLGGLHLGASLIDALARLTCDEQGGDIAQYMRFVRKYLPTAYDVDDLPKQLYAGVRAVGLHNLSVGRRLALMDGQLDRSMHLSLDGHGRRIIRVEEFVTDLRSAVGAWEKDLDEYDELRKRILDRERRNPVYDIIMVEAPETFDSVAPTSTVPATGVADYPMRAPVSASAAVGPVDFNSR
jgi:hypothetical protein